MSTTNLSNSNTYEIEKNIIYQKNTFNKNQIYHALIEIKTNRILSLSNHMMTATKLSEESCNTFCLYYFNTPNIHFIPKHFKIDIINHRFHSIEILTDINLNEIYNYKITKGVIVKDEIIDENNKFKLLIDKADALDYINKFIAYYRRPYNMDIGLQQETYHLKYLEALNFFENQEDFYPFIEGYSETKNISLDQAAKEIKIKTECYYAALAKIENLRIKFTNLILNETDIINIPNILIQFMNEGRYYGYM